MMPDTVTRSGPATGPARTVSPTPFRTPAHTRPAPAHMTHTSVPGIPGSATPCVGGPSRPSRLVHTAGSLVHTPSPSAAARMWTVSVLVWAARWVAPTVGGLFLVGGAYAGPLSVVPAPVLLALAAVGFTVQTTPAGGDR